MLLRHHPPSSSEGLQGPTPKLLHCPPHTLKTCLTSEWCCQAHNPDEDMCKETNVVLLVPSTALIPLQLWVLSLTRACDP